MPAADTDSDVSAAFFVRDGYLPKTPSRSTASPRPSLACLQGRNHVQVSSQEGARPPQRTRHGGPRRIGDVADDVVRGIGLQAIRFHLNRAAASGGCEALASVREANAIRRQLGLSWNRAVASDDALV